MGLGRDGGGRGGWWSGDFGGEVIQTTSHKSAMELSAVVFDFSDCRKFYYKLRALAPAVVIHPFTPLFPLTGIPVHDNCNETKTLNKIDQPASYGVGAGVKGGEGKQMRSHLFN